MLGHRSSLTGGPVFGVHYRAKAHGWRTQLWTAARAAELIERHFGIRFHPEHARKILKRRLRWTSQKPQKRAKERDEVAIDH